MPRNGKPADEYYDEDEDDQYYDDDDEDDDRPSNYHGDAGNQAIAYMLTLLTKQQKQTLSLKRGKGKAPSSEHSSHGSPPRKKRPPTDKEDDYRSDPNFQLPAPSKRGRGSRGGRVKGRGRGRGRGRGKSNDSEPSILHVSGDMNESSSSGTKGKHWRPNELRALIIGANHLKPVLKGKFKHSCDGTTLKQLAWEELKEYVMTIGKIDRSVDQCKDKLSYYTQDAKKKRQRIDAKYSTGSGKREEEDYMTELEAAACDYAGEEVTLGIPGMQPPNLKGGERSERPWSCYDPDRETKEDYEALRMPSSAMTAVVEGNLLESVDGADVSTYNNANLADDPAEVMEYQEYADTETYIDENCAEDVTNTHSEPLENRVSRGDMLKICSDLNKRKVSQKKDNNSSAVGDFLLSGSSSQKSKQSLLTSAMDILRKRQAEGKASTNRYSDSVAKSIPPAQSAPVCKAVPVSKGVPVSKPVAVSEAVPVSKPVPVMNQAPERKPESHVNQHNSEDKCVNNRASEKPTERKIRKSASFSKIINESFQELGTPEDSPDPPKMYTKVAQKEGERIFTKEEVDELIRRSHERTKQSPSDFTTSTPHKIPSPIIPTKTVKTPKIPTRSSPRIQQLASTKQHNTSGLDKIERALSSSKRNLFEPEPGCSGGSGSLESIPPHSPLATDLDQSMRNEILMSDVNTMNRNLMATQSALGETVNIVSKSVSANLKEMAENMNRNLKATQTSLADSANTISESVSGNMKEISENMTVTLKQHAEETAENIKNHTDTFVRAQKQLLDTHEENNEAITEIDEKLGERLLLRQIKMVKGFENMANAIEKASEKVCSSQQSMITGMINMTDEMTRMSGAMSNLVQSTQSLKESQMVSMKALEKADVIILKVVANLEHLTDAQENMYKQQNNQQQVYEQQTQHQQMQQQKIHQQQYQEQPIQQQPIQQQQFQQQQMQQQQIQQQPILQPPIQQQQIEQQPMQQQQIQQQPILQQPIQQQQIQQPMQQQQIQQQPIQQQPSQQHNTQEQNLQHQQMQQNLMHQQQMNGQQVLGQQVMQQTSSQQQPLRSILLVRNKHAVQKTSDADTVPEKPEITDHLSSHAEDQRAASDLQSINNIGATTSAYLTHPFPHTDEEKPLYNSAYGIQEEQDQRYVVPASTIIQQCSSSNDGQGQGLPTFRVLNKDHFVIFHENGEPPEQETKLDNTQDIQILQSLGTVQNIEQISEAETEGSVSDTASVVDIAKPELKRSKRIRKTRNQCD